MSGNNEHEHGNNSPNPLERLRQAGGAVVGMFFADPSFGDQLKDEMLAEKGYEDGIVLELRKRVSALDTEAKIEAAKSKHPSSRGYL